ncbi:MAG: autotransporter-associated beta strand repeat-containing protein [Planctomycetia bacterium]|nr:autotransporter-associated beta strand repeat-containing protein [Planctomycetia bacterium]
MKKTFFIVLSVASLFVASPLFAQTAQTTYTGNITENVDITDNPIAITITEGNTYGIADTYKISGTGTVTFNGTGQFNINSANDYSGDTTISAGTVSANNNSAFGTSDIKWSGGTITVNAARTLSNNIHVANEVTLNTGGNRNITLTGNLTGDGVITRTGPYTVFLQGDNSEFSGTWNASQSNTYIDNANSGSALATWNVDAGCILAGEFGNGTIDLGALTGSGTVRNTVANTALTYNIGGKNIDSEFSGIIQDYRGTVAITKTGTRTLTLSGANTYASGTTVSQGTLVLNNATAAGSGTITLGDANTGANNTQLTLATSIANDIIISENGTGTATIVGATHTGTHTGTLTVNRDTYLTTTFNGNAQWFSFSDGGITGTGNLIIKTANNTDASSGGDRISLAGDNTDFSGNLIVESGMLQIGSADAAGSGQIILGNNQTADGAKVQLRLGANITNAITVDKTAEIGTWIGMQIVASPITFNANTTFYPGSDRFTFQGAWSGDGDITIAQSRVTHDTAANTWTGNMTINSGTIFQPGHAQTLNQANSVTVNGTLQLNNVDQTINGLSGSGTVQNVWASDTNTLTVGAGNADSTFDGTIQNGHGTLALTKSGTGTLTLINDGDKLTYTGNTTLNQGQLNVSGKLVSNLIADTIDGSSSLAIFSPGAEDAVGTATLSGAASFSDAILKIEVDDSGMDFLSVNEISFTNDSLLSIELINNFTLPVGLETEYAFLSSTNALPDIDWESIATPATSALWNFRTEGNVVYASLDPTQVPEPSTYLLLLFAGACLMVYRRMKK